MIGAVQSYRPLALPGPKRVYDVHCGVVRVWAAYSCFGCLWPYPEIDLRMPAAAARVLLAVDKEGLHPMRLLSILSLAWLVSRVVPVGAQWLRSWSAKPFVLCGQHSLPVFCASIFLSFLGRLAMEERPDWIAQAGVNVIGAAALVGVGALAAWYRQKGAMARAAVLPAAKRTGNARVI